MSIQQKLTYEEIDHLLNLVREHWPKIFDYEESVPPLGIANHHRSQHIYPSQRLTIHLVQFSGLVHLQLQFFRILLCRFQDIFKYCEQLAQ